MTSKPTTPNASDCENCPTCGGTGIDKNTDWNETMVEGVDFTWCETCDGTGVAEEEVEAPYRYFDNEAAIRY